MLNNLRRIDLDPSHFAPLQIGHFEVSIQASERACSTPRVTLDTAEGYTAFQVAIFDTNGWVQPRNDPRFAGRAWAHRFEDFGFASLGEYVPREEVGQILADLQGMLD